MSSPIDTTYVEIEPRTENFERRAEASFEQVAALGDRVVEAIERAFEGMADVVGRQFDELRREADTNMDALIATVDRVGDDIGREINQGTESAERAFDELRRSADRDLDSVERRAASASASIRGHFGALGASIGVGGIAAAGLSVAAAGLGALTTFGLKSAASLEQVQIQFNSLLGSAEQGQKVFSDLQKFAAATPFEFPDVARAAARFLAFDQTVGLSDDQLQQFLTTTGNVISVTGGGAEALNTVSLAMGQIASTGKLTLDNLNQISEALPGFSAVGAIANATGLSTADVMDKISKGEINATDGIQALLKGMQQFPGAAGAMEAQSQTLLGVFSTFKDTVGQALAGAFTPVIPAIKDSLNQITPIIGDSLKVVAPALGNVLAALLPLIGRVVEGIAPILEPLLNGLAQGVGQLGPVITLLGNALTPLAVAVGPLLSLIGQVAGTITQALTPAITVIATIIGDSALPIIQALQQIFTALQPTIVLIGNTLGTQLAPFFDALVPLAGEFADALIKLTPDLIQLAEASLQALIAATPLIDFFVQILPYMLTFVTVGEPVISFLLQLATALIQLPQTLANLVDAFAGWIGSVGTAIGNFISQAVDWFTQLPGRIGSALVALPGILVNVVSTAANNVLFLIGFMIGTIVGTLEKLPQRIGSFFEAAWDWAYNASVQRIEATLSFLRSLPPRLGQIIQDAMNRLTSLFSSGVSNASNTLSALPGRVWGIVSQIPGIVWNAISGLPGTLYSAGRNAIIGLVNGIESLLSWAVSAAWNAAKRIASGFLSALKISSPSKLFEEAGRYSIEGYTIGLTSEAKTIDNTLTRIVTPLPQAATQAAQATPAAPGFHGTVIVNVGGRQVEGVIMDILYNNTQDVAQAAAQGNRELVRR